MTKNDKLKILELREKGLSYNEISIELNLSRNTVISFLRRYKVKENKEKITECLNCGLPLTNIVNHKKKKFCCLSCKNKWWRKHQDELHSKSLITRKCLYCGNEFKSYKSKDKKYCSHNCYLNHRFQNGNHYE